MIHHLLRNLSSHLLVLQVRLQYDIVYDTMNSVALRLFI